MKRVLTLLAMAAFVSATFSVISSAKVQAAGNPGPPSCYGGETYGKHFRAVATVCVSNFGKTLNVNARITKANEKVSVVACAGAKCTQVPKNGSGNFAPGGNPCPRYNVLEWAGGIPDRVEFRNAHNRVIAIAMLSKERFVADNNQIALCFL